MISAQESHAEVRLREARSKRMRHQMRTHGQAHGAPRKEPHSSEKAVEQPKT